MNINIYPIPATPQRIKVTPEIAADWLENRNSISNRKLSDHTAGKYARIMEAGRWLSTHQGIAFDDDGWLIDGQHRLRAVVLSGITVEMFVVPDCDPATFTVLDSGLKRNAGQLIKLPSSRTIAAAARVLATIYAPVPTQTTQGGVYDGHLTTDIILETVDAWPELGTYVAHIETVYKYTKVNRPMHLAVIAQAARSSYYGRIDSWIDGLTQGAGLESNDPRLLLRNRFVRDSAALNGGVDRGITYSLIAKAWNAHAQQRTLGVLRVIEAEGVIRVLD